MQIKGYIKLMIGILFFCCFLAGCKESNSVPYKTLALLAQPGPANLTRINGVEQFCYRPPVSPDWDNSECSPELYKDDLLVPNYKKGDAITDDGIYTLILTCGNKTYTSKFLIDSTFPNEKIYTNSNELGIKLIVDVRVDEMMKEDTYGPKPLYVIWVEDSNGEFIQNLFVANTPATNVMRFTKDWKARPNAVPYWAHKACIEDPYNNGNTEYLFLALPRIDAQNGVPIPEDLDAVTGATRYIDFSVNTKGKNGLGRQFKVLFEINKSGDSYAGYYDNENPVIPPNDPFLKYYDKSQPSIIYAADINLDSGVMKYQLQPIGIGHFSGKDGGLYDPGLSTISTAKNMIKQITVYVFE